MTAYQLTERSLLILANLLPGAEWPETRQQSIAAMRLLASDPFTVLPTKADTETPDAFEKRLDSAEVALDLTIDQAAAIKRCLTWHLDQRKVFLSRHLLPLVTLFEIT